jgi:hypothetical protein
MKYFMKKIEKMLKFEKDNVALQNRIYDSNIKRLKLGYFFEIVEKS